MDITSKLPDLEQIDPELRSEDGLLEINETENAVVVIGRGPGATLLIVVGLVAWSALALACLALLLPMLVSPFFMPIKLFDYFFAIAVVLAPTIVGLIFALQCFQLGWNDTVLTITDDQIRVHFEGKFARSRYSFPLSTISASGVKTGVFGSRLVLEHSLGLGYSRGALLEYGSEAALTWIETRILEKMKSNGHKSPIDCGGPGSILN